MSYHLDRPYSISLHHPYNGSRIKPPTLVEHYMDELFTPKYEDHYEPEKSLPHRASPIVLLDDDRKDRVTITDDAFIIKLNTDGYKPQELSVKTTDKFIHVEGHHEEMSPNSQVSRSFSKKWPIPDRVHVHKISSFINSNNAGDFLIIKGPRHTPTPEQNKNDKKLALENGGGKSSQIHFDFDLAEEAKENNYL